MYFQLTHHEKIMKSQLHGTDLATKFESKIPLTEKPKLMAPCGWKAKTVRSF